MIIFGSGIYNGTTLFQNDIEHCIGPCNLNVSDRFANSGDPDQIALARSD